MRPCVVLKKVCILQINVFNWICETYSPNNKQKFVSNTCKNHRISRTRWFITSCLDHSPLIAKRIKTAQIIKVIIIITSTKHEQFFFHNCHLMRVSWSRVWLNLEIMPSLCLQIYRTKSFLICFNLWIFFFLFFYPTKQINMISQNCTTLMKTISWHFWRYCSI